MILRLKYVKGSWVLLILLVNHLLKTMKELKNLKKQEIEDIFIKTN